jgi:adenylate cyclase
MSDVFISYARSTEAQARQIGKSLRALGYGVWRDDELPAHRAYAEVIEERLRAAKAVVVVWSAEAVKSQWVRAEADLGRQGGTLVQLSIDGAVPPLPFNQIQCADMNGWHGDANAPGWRKIVESVTELVGTETRADPPGAATPPHRSGIPSRRAIAAVSAAGLVAVAGLLMWGPLRKMQAPPSMRSIALLPVRNLSGDPALDATAEALTEDAVDLMGRTGESRVPPLSAILATRANPSDDLAKGRKLDVRYVVSASLRKASPGLRLSYRVLDTADGHLVGSGDYVNSASDVALAERRLVLKLHYGLGSLLLPRFIADQLARPANDRDPENVHARLMDLGNHLSRRDVPTAERLIAAAKAIPDTADLKAGLEISACLTYYAMITNGYASSPAQRLAWAGDALDLGARAALLKPSATSPHECRVYAFMALERWDDAMAEAKHILQTNPNSANAYEDIAGVEFARGQFGDALRDYTERAERHEQGDPFDLGLSHLYLGDYGPAIENFREFEVQSPKASGGPFFNAAALQLSGRRDEALSQAGLYRRLKADDTDWTALAQSHEPAFLAAASRVRHALHQVGLDDPGAGPIAARTDR